MQLIALITSVSKPMSVCALRTLSSSGITSRLRLGEHHRSVMCNLRSHGLSGSGSMTK